MTRAVPPVRPSSSAAKVPAAPEGAAGINNFSILCDRHVIAVNTGQRAPKDHSAPKATPAEIIQPWCEWQGIETRFA
jgi:hypothetical protein